MPVPQNPARDLADLLADFFAELARGQSPGDAADDLQDGISKHLGQVRRAETFDAVGMATSDAGLVIWLRDGRELQITVVRSK